MMTQLGIRYAESSRGGTSLRNHVLQNASEWSERPSLLFLFRRKKDEEQKKDSTEAHHVLCQPQPVR